MHVAAFETQAEAKLVDELRKVASPIVSLVAEDLGEIVGHILFTPVSLEGDADSAIMGLAPMAVAPSRQRRGIGSELARTGMKNCRELGFGAIVVLGHPDYYPRFGFSPSRQFGIGCVYEVPEEAFMAVELQDGYLNHKSGTVRYNEAFNKV